MWATNDAGSRRVAASGSPPEFGIKHLVRWSPLSLVQGTLVLSFARLVAYALLVFGVVGLFITGFDYFSNVTGIPFLMFTINPNTNVIHLVAGLVGIAMTGRAELARRYLLLIGVLGLPWAITGYIVDETMADFFARNIPLVNLHLGISLVSLALVFWNRWPALAPTQLAAEPTDGAQ